MEDETKLLLQFSKLQQRYQKVLECHEKFEEKMKLLFESWGITWEGYGYLEIEDSKGESKRVKEKNGDDMIVNKYVATGHLNDEQRGRIKKIFDHLDKLIDMKIGLLDSMDAIRNQIFIDGVSKYGFPLAGKFNWTMRDGQLALVMHNLREQRAFGEDSLSNYRLAEKAGERFMIGGNRINLRSFETQIGKASNGFIQTKIDLNEAMPFVSEILKKHG